MELVVCVNRQEAFRAALEAGVNGVAVPLPPGPASSWWSATATWRTAARHQGIKFYLVWDWLVREEALPGALDLLAGIARMAPEALVLRDLGILRKARRRFPELPLHAAGNWGAHNSPSLGLAENLGFRRVVLDGPISLKDLALLRRHTSLPLEVVTPPRCGGFAGLCLVPEYLGIDCRACGAAGQQHQNPASVITDGLKTISGWSRLGIEAVQLSAEFFPKDSLGQVVALCRELWAASPMDRPRFLAAAREVPAAVGEGLWAGSPPTDTSAGEAAPASPRARPSPSPPRLPAEMLSGRGRVWLEARGHAEAAALSREWRGSLVITLTPDNYAAFLKDHRRWHPRRLIWRLPPVVRESALSFYQKALETLQQGGYSRFLAGNWGGVALARAAGGEVLGDQTLGIRNAEALKTAREVGLTRVCLPPGQRPGDWRELVKAAPAAGFWSYLYHVPALAVCPSAVAPRPGPAPEPNGPGIHWGSQEDLALLCQEHPDHLEHCAAWFQQHGVAPLLVALPRSRLPWGRVPPPTRSRPERRRPGRR